MRFSFAAGLRRLLLPGLGIVALATPALAQTTLLNASYDVSRSVYKELNPAFAAAWKTRTGQDARIDQSHGASSKQARAVLDGLEADVLTMNNALDLDAVAAANPALVPADWRTRLPNGASPSFSAILFVVRKGNPKAIRDWPDLARDGVQVIVPNPKTSGNGRYSYLAAWEHARRAGGGDAGAAREGVRRLFAHVPVLDTGGRGATTTFAQRGIGDVLLTFENEISLLRAELGADQFEVVIPSLTVRADNPVTVVEANAAKRGTTALARAYAEFHFTEEAQEIFARNGLRPVSEAVLARHAAQLPNLKLFTVEEAFGSWAEAQRVHFADGGTWDQIQAAR